MHTFVYEIKIMNYVYFLQFFSIKCLTSKRRWKRTILWNYERNKLTAKVSVSRWCSGETTEKKLPAIWQIQTPRLDFACVADVQRRDGGKLEEQSAIGGRLRGKETFRLLPIRFRPSSSPLPFAIKHPPRRPAKTVPDSPL